MALVKLKAKQQLTSIDGNTGNTLVSIQPGEVFTCSQEYCDAWGSNDVEPAQESDPIHHNDVDQVIRNARN